MKPAKNVDEYIAQAPKEVQEKLKERRSRKEKITFEKPLRIFI